MLLKSDPSPKVMRCQCWASKPMIPAKQVVTLTQAFGLRIGKNGFAARWRLFCQPDREQHDQHPLVYHPWFKCKFLTACSDLLRCSLSILQRLSLWAVLTSPSRITDNLFLKSSSNELATSLLNLHQRLLPNTPPDSFGPGKKPPPKAWQIPVSGCCGIGCSMWRKSFCFLCFLYFMMYVIINFHISINNNIKNFRWNNKLWDFMETSRK